MPLANLNSVLDYNGLEYGVAEKAFKKINQTEKLLRKWIGDSKYDEILADTAHTYYDELKQAESLLCFALALPRLGMYIREKGGLTQSTGYNETRNEIMRMRELKRFQREIRSEARNLISDLILPTYRIDRRERGVRYVSS